MMLSRFEVADWKTHVAVTGDGPATVYLHGFDVPATDLPFLEGLARSRRIFVPRLPGFAGASEAHHGIRTVQDLALHIRELILSLGEDSVDLIGHSLGGMIAAETAAVSSDVVRSVVLADSYGLWDDDNPLPDPFLYSGEKFRRAVGHQEPEVTDPIADKLWRATDVAAATKYLWPIPDRGLRRRCRFVASPTLVLHGSEDPLIPVTYAETLTDLLPKAQLEIIEGAGHAPMIDEPEKFVKVVGDFFEESYETLSRSGANGRS